MRGDVPEEHDFVQILAVGLFDGISALRVALDLLGAPVARHISVESSEHAHRVVEANFPDTILVNNVEDVTEELVLGWSLRFSGVGLVLVGGGPPCQGVSGLNFDRKGALRDARSSLYPHMTRVSRLLKRFFRWAQVHTLVENVGSMDWEDCNLMNEEFETKPWFIDSDGVSLAHGPRVYWVTWELEDDDPGVEILQGSDGRLPILGEIKLSGEIDQAAFLEPGWTKAANKAFPTFTTSRPSPHPLRRPAGLKDCEPHELKRWSDDLHRFPPYQYKDCHCVVSRDGTFRPPSILERESILGFPAGYTKQCLKKSEHSTSKHSDLRLTFLGNSWSVPVVT